MPSLKGKVAVVTGASTKLGIGEAIALCYAKAGGTLFLVADRTQEDLDRVSAACREAGAEQVKPLVLDLGLPGAPEEMVSRALAAFGRVDVLVNNAGIRSSFDFGDYTREQFDRSIAVNIGAAFFASQAVVPAMREQGGGRIINIASQLAQVAFTQRALYGLTKAALVHLTKSKAYELTRHNIMVNAISPGPIATQPTLDRDPALVQERLDRYVPARRLGQPEEIGEVALYLATDCPTYVQGHDLVVDGGYVLH